MGPLSEGWHRHKCVCRLLLLDMLLGNPDRFPCEALGWRGNPNNVLYCSHGRLQVHVRCSCAFVTFWESNMSGCRLFLVVSPLLLRQGSMCASYLSILPAGPLM